MSGAWIAAATLLGGLLGVGGLGTVMVERMKIKAAERAAEKSDGPHKMIDQLQEERAEDRDRIATLERRADAAANREQIRDDYIMTLRQHIADGKPPPPPPFPAGLYGSTTAP